MRAPRTPKAGVWRGVCCCAAALPLSGLLLSLALDAAVLAQTPPPTLSSASTPYANHIAEAAQRFDIPEHWIAAVLAAESAGEASAVSSAGAIGLMQIMPDTWAELRARYHLGDDPFDRRDNIVAGTAYLREMLDRYQTIGGMLAAYNAGPGRYDEYLSAGRALPQETRAYVANLAPLLGGDELPDNAKIVAPVSSDWRDAGIFVARANAPAMPAPIPDDRIGNTDPVAQPSGAASASDAPHATLFVPLSSTGTAR